MQGDPQGNVDFYAGVLGLRLIKKTINFDAPEVYHLYFGNEQGSPGTIITFFPAPPGFTVDEELNELGHKLMLPEWYEPQRSVIESNLVPVEPRVIKQD
ncbi:catechol 2,3-dioxygenase-like lactoylglutathione lyase family enzyme [Paenibacillus brasilensis]|uniref:Catechol 2,3-dioxygenase-like lactoylglutathione lyase family enzyme n=1 Tax=Paenibacillus brasilensis TaxID=128574 RepID=A0ABU0L6S4_9BACL|nr:catechol 2,3-dioxygenase-like lactoylglutathione lyase family enzyme [Paenibacillus brasilensis]